MAPPDSPAKAAHSHGGHGHDHGQAGPVVRDPVCGMTVDPEAGKPTAEHDGHVFHFCSEGCRGKFVAEPGDYLTARDPVCGMDVDRATAANMTKQSRWPRRS